MKYILMLIVVLTAGCSTGKYPQCLSHAPNPSKPFDEFISHPLYRDAYSYIIPRMQDINVEYGSGYELKYLNFLVTRGNISRQKYENIKQEYIFYMPRQ